ncbi:GIY-YIG nuclease family protein [Acholeplasma laidlawii]|uniref:GIY-YIG nuclease family protein n=1 Tax=Acholeplasma laidlawii TaxID=2148 RepID=UPI001E51AAFA|nr:GIY-YIG nuclease family protein [Acholeplasma laidlawii]
MIGLKLGKSSRLPEVRGRELYNTAVPLPYEIFATLQTGKYNEAERMIHRSIDRISDLRINKGRGFFNIASESV